MRLELREIFQAGNIDSEIIGKQILFKAMGRDEIAKTVAEKKILKHFNTREMGGNQRRIVRRPACD